MNLIKVNTTHGTITTEPFPVDRLIGGRAVIDWYLTSFVAPTVHPLSADSPLIVAPGLLAGTTAPSSGRLSIGGKSPLTGGIKESNVGGTPAHKLGRLGIQAIVVEGKAESWQILRLDAKGATLESADDITGLDNYEACEKLRQRYGKDIGILIIGVAGERLYTNSTVAATDPEGRPCRHAGRGGVGAIMGSKGLKAIIIDDAGASFRKPSDQKAFNAAIRTATEMLRSAPYIEMLHRSGTAYFISADNGRGSLQTNNYRAGSFDHFKNINADKFIELNAARGGIIGHGCMPGCAVQCSNTFHDDRGAYVTAGLEYETLVMLGSNLGIDDLDAVARMDRRCDGLGIDTIETGASIGILNDVGLFDFGDTVRAEALIEEIAQGSPLGRVLGNGTQTTARVFGISRVPTVKGQAIPGHSGRSLKGWGVTYATTPQGADHTAGAVIEDPLSSVGQVERSRNSQIVNTALDAIGLCHFTFLYKTPDLIVPMINALLDVQWTVADYVELGKEMLRQERSFNLKAGIGPEADRLPDWMRTEHLPPLNPVFDVPQEEINEFFNF